VQVLLLHKSLKKKNSLAEDKCVRKCKKNIFPDKQQLSTVILSANTAIGHGKLGATRCQLKEDYNDLEA